MPNPIFAAAGGIQIVKADLSAPATIAWLVFFILVSLSSMITPVVLYARSPAATGLRSAGWKQWLGVHTGQILTWDVHRVRRPDRRGERDRIVLRW